tara:strand:+ start:1492 stop:1737 length:246 start_codon:yes stop_codon:yes gene_type:complete
MVITAKIKIKYIYLIVIMDFTELKELKNYIESDLSNYNSFDERNLTNEKRDLFMKISFIIFIIALIGKIIHLLLLKYKVCN